jgi:hypothetical protein
LNLTPTNSQLPDLQLNFLKTSKFIHLTDTFLKPKKMTALLTSYKSLADTHSMTLADFKRRFNEIDTTSQPVDIGFYSYILKVIASKD